MTRIVHFSNLLDRIDFDWNTECWNWRGSKTEDGYGRTSFYGKLRLTHRLSKYLFGHMSNRKFNDPSWVVMHQCDNPACINPHHLKVGTQLDNIADRTRKGRSARNRPRNKFGQFLTNEELGMAETRIYVVVNKTTGERRLIEATSQSQAIKHCATPVYEASVASSKTVGHAMTEGLRIEIAEMSKDRLTTP